MSRDGEIAALLREREAYQRYGKVDRLAAVDEQLRLRGYEHPETPQGRSAKPLETAEQPKRKGRPRQESARDAED